MIRKTLERSEGGVVLIRVQDLSAADRPVPLGYRLSTPWSSAVIADRAEAHAAFAAAVAEAAQEPTARRRAAARG